MWTGQIDNENPLIQAWAGGDSLIITKAEGYAQNVLKQELELAGKVTFTEGVKIKVRVPANTEAYNLDKIIIYAKLNQSATEAELIEYTASVAQPIPSVQTDSEFLFDIDCLLTGGASSDIDVIITSGIYVTNISLSETLENYPTTEETIELIQQTAPQERFMAEYNVTTLAQIEAAEASGKTCYVNQGFYRARLEGIINNVAYFSSAYSLEGSSPELQTLMCDQNGWSTSHHGLAKSYSPTLSGVPTAPTASAGANNTQIATTGFVSQALANISTTTTTTATIPNSALWDYNSLSLRYYNNVTVAGIPASPNTLCMVSPTGIEDASIWVNCGMYCEDIPSDNTVRFSCDVPPDNSLAVNVAIFS